jgi:flagellar motor switch protein FliM
MATERTVRQDEPASGGAQQHEIDAGQMQQEDLDALFAAAGAAAGSQAAAADSFVSFDYASAGQISADQLRAVSLLNDLFARNLTHNLAAWLRTSFQVNLVSAEQIPFQEFLLRIPEISYVASVRLEPLSALSVLQLDLALVPPIIDLLLGGEGRDGPLRELTDIEEAILGSVVEVVCRELSVAWQSVGLSFRFDRRQMQTQVARILSASEKTLCLSFEIRMPHGSGLLNLAFPAVVANTLLRRLATDWGKRRRHAGDARALMEAAARRIRFGCSLQLPSVRVPASALENLAPGSLIRLNLPANTAPVWRVAGQPLNQAQAIRQGPHRAARIDRVLPRQLSPNQPGALSEEALA